MSAIRLACDFERQTNAYEIRRDTIKPALCEPACIDLAIDGRMAQVGEPGGILHGVCPVANESPAGWFVHRIVQRNTKNLAN
ncbi:hypothetical protein FJ546_28495 [Mesorhizobium sp. B2-4-19]|uniref:hypothetical protein n=1 Tax=Mesorhizobium sp. B2-4-19 TaxID=2589930 RepID=UPI00112D9D99|nr:hypothetical protein [Mesorhizobium sp. B2-4-19]TPK55942.1 hypothetical protein FJ546_28495 [Mesorhizobium sp. B2-4-19]